MPWTEPQTLNVLEEYWQRGSATCPTCQAVVRFNCKWVSDGYLLFAHCPRGCGDFTRSRTNDPRKDEFRQWTQEEGEAIHDAHFVGKHIVCPVDGGPVEVTEQRTNKGNNVIAVCRRCGNGWSEKYPRA